MKQNNNKIHQTGFSFITVMGVILLLYFTVIVIALVPSYVENFIVKSSLTSLIADRSIVNKSENNIKAILMKKLSISNVTHVAENDVSVTKNNSSIEVHIDYTVKTKFISNVDFVISFNEHKEVSL